MKNSLSKRNSLFKKVFGNIILTSLSVGCEGGGDDGASFPVLSCVSVSVRECE
jgi:hypothetical protein